MHEEVINDFKTNLSREIAKQSVLRDFYLKKAGGETKEEGAKLKLKATQLEDNIAFNQEFLDFVNTL